MQNPTLIAHKLAARYPHLAPASRYYAHIASSLPPGRLQQAERIARKFVALEMRSPSVTRTQLQTRLTNAVTEELGGLADDADIMAIAFVVMMTATNDMDQDLKDIMAGVKAQTTAKAKLRALISEVNQAVANSAGQSADSFQQTLTWALLTPYRPRIKP